MSIPIRRVRPQYDENEFALPDGMSYEVVEESGARARSGAARLAPAAAEGDCSPPALLASVAARADRADSACAVSPVVPASFAPAGPQL